MRRGRNAMHEAAMSFYRDQVYPHLVSWLGNPKPIEEIRQRLVPLAKGNVLEIGVGPGTAPRNPSGTQQARLESAATMAAAGALFSDSFIVPVTWSLGSRIATQE